MKYLDFEVSMEEAATGYQVSVLYSPEGQASELVKLPFGREELERRLEGLHQALARARGDRDVVTEGPAADPQQTARELGEALFETLFAGDVRGLFIQSRREAMSQQNRGLRVRFRTQDPRLATLPWELLYDRRIGSFLCLSRATPFVRFLPTQQPKGTLRITPPLRVLGMVSSPSELDQLDVAREKQIVEGALSKLPDVDVHWLSGGSWRELRDALEQSGPWHAFHFIGHGGFDGSQGLLVLTTENGGRYDLSADRLADLLDDHPSLRLVVLNSCKGAKGSSGELFSSSAATLVRRGTAAVVSMRQDISDEAALQFSQEFYGAIGRGEPVDGAVARAREGISLALPRSLEWTTPTIHMQTPDGRLFELDSVDTSGEDPSAAPSPNAWPDATHGTNALLSRWRGIPAGALALLGVLAALAYSLVGKEILDTSQGPLPASAVESIVLHPQVASIATGGSVQLHVTLQDKSGAIVTGPVVSWGSDDGSVASVASGGRVMAHSPGKTRITATSEGKQGSAGVFVGDGTAYRLHKVSGEGMTIQLEKFAPFSVKVVDFADRPVVGAKVAWRTPIDSTKYSWRPPPSAPTTYVGVTDSAGISTATQLYAFPNAGVYHQTAGLVATSSAPGLTTTSPPTIGDSVIFTYHHQ